MGIGSAKRQVVPRALRRSLLTVAAAVFAAGVFAGPVPIAAAQVSASVGVSASASVSIGATPDPNSAVVGALVNWSALLPGLTDAYAANDPHICNSGSNACVQAVLAEMDHRLAGLAHSCSHAAMFALLYDHITASYLHTVTNDPRYFHSNPFVNHEDAVFASFYFRAFDDYASGNRSAVPGAWQVAFDAAGSRAVSGEGNILLGVNAHIRRDLPFVLYRIGLTEPDGTSLKPDHDAVNPILYGAFGDAISDAGARLDPSVNPNLPPALAPLGYATLYQTVEGWREEAFRNAELLASAPNDSARALVAAQIEQNATKSAQLISAATAYGPGSNSAARDAYCAAAQSAH